MGSPFKIKEHVIDAQYIRDSPRATATPDAPLKLCIKQYTPLDNPDPQPGDVTIVVACGTSFPKEVYEPLWEEVLARSKQDGFRIRAIWVPDAVTQGASGIMNEHILGNESSMADHGRDIIHMISHFRAEMPHPIMGIGHSGGTCQLVIASLAHPRLFTSLMLIEAFLDDDPIAGGGATLIFWATEKRDKWCSHAEAAEKAKKNLRHWDPRALERWVEYGFRKLPTAIYPCDPSQPDAVTLASTKYQETMSYTYVNPQPAEVVRFPGELYDGKQKPIVPGRQLYRVEPIAAFKLLPHLVPSVLFMGGERSQIVQGGSLERQAKATGTGWSGNGGLAAGRVKAVVIEKANHTLPMEKVENTAMALGPWMKQEAERWKVENAKLAEEWGSLSTKERTTFPPEWLKLVETTKAHL